MGRKKGCTSWCKGIKRPEMCGENNPTKRPEVREKIRKSVLKLMDKSKGWNLPPQFMGKYEKPMLDALEESFGYTILRQYKVSHYFLDGYCPALNLAIEIDPIKGHKYTKHKDSIRQTEIENKLNCKFLRIPFGGKI